MCETEMRHESRIPSVRYHLEPWRLSQSFHVVRSLRSVRIDAEMARCMVECCTISTLDTSTVQC